MSHWWTQACREPDAAGERQALARQARLTKPAGALGQLETLAVQLAALQGREMPSADRVAITVFAADHGVAARGVSAFPQAVTQQMIANFAAGGAAISVLARALGARLEVVDVGSLNQGAVPAGVVDARIAAGTADFSRRPAMSAAQLEQALAAGRAAVVRAGPVDLFIAGDMGIANTTAATALACVLLGAAPRELAGPGTGLDADGVSRKAAVIAEALALHAAHRHAPEAALARLGGFEIAAIAGSYIACAQAGLAVLVDGFIASSAALCAIHLNPAVRPWLLFAHRSAEPGHARLLAAMAASPLIDLGLRLGEASGAAIAVPLLRLACALHEGMATFASAGVSGKSPC
ncbi:MAG: nicotinate-nucleotide--dimethylbenzimidazole phosphoribosyltransferase [Xanthomonadaceae bacterium]|nr:nicotinate-nucleotide--dimethylbenzimidazole phosphoribosyltransferase [Xanthomonadaceae bacterium]